MRLEIDHEAKALMLAVGAQAYWVARRRAEEASSDEMAKGWTGVAAVIERRTAKRTSLLSYLLHFIVTVVLMGRRILVSWIESLVRLTGAVGRRGDLIPEGRAQRGVSKDDPACSSAAVALWSVVRDAPSALLTTMRLGSNAQYFGIGALGACCIWLEPDPSLRSKAKQSRERRGSYVPLDCFVALNAPRNDEVDGPARTASSAKGWSLARHKRGGRPWMSLSELVLIWAKAISDLCAHCDCCDQLKLLSRGLKGADFLRPARALPRGHGGLRIGSLLGARACRDGM